MYICLWGRLGRAVLGVISSYVGGHADSRRSCMDTHEWVYSLDRNVIKASTDGGLDKGIIRDACETQPTDQKCIADVSSLPTCGFGGRTETD